MSEIELQNRLKAYRALFGWTQAEVAEKVGLSRRSVNAIENGEFVPSITTALRFARLYRVRVEDLFRLRDDGEPWTPNLA